jgi:hypothetical protein
VKTLFEFADAFRCSAEQILSPDVFRSKTLFADAIASKQLNVLVPGENGGGMKNQGDRLPVLMSNLR